MFNLLRVNPNEPRLLKNGYCRSLVAVIAPRPAPALYLPRLTTLCTRSLTKVLGPPLVTLDAIADNVICCVSTVRQTRRRD